jgi:hypothetical protein
MCEIPYIIISGGFCNIQSSVPIKHVEYMLQKEDCDSVELIRISYVSHPCPRYNKIVFLSSQ